MICLLFLAAAGCATPRYTFDVTADMRSYTPPEHAGPSYFQGVAEAIRDLGPGDFMVTAGDLDPPDRVKAVLDEMLGPDYPFYPAVGNHELDKPEHMVWLRAYNEGGRKLPGIVRAGPPGAVETCYSFDHENAHVVVINQYYDGQRDNVKGGVISPALLAWLEEDLAATRQPLIFVVGHEPHVSVPDITNGRVRHRGDSLDADEASNHRFWSLLREHRVCAYFCGHTHNTSISRINGVWQIDAGHARGKGDKGALSSFVKIAVEGEKVRCDMYRSDDPGTSPYRLVWSEPLR